MIGENVTLLATGGGYDVGQIDGPTTINQPHNFASLSTSQKKLLSTAQVSDVVGVSYETYQYLGGIETNVDLTLEDFSNDTRWQIISPDIFTGTNTTVPNVVLLTTNQYVLVQYNVDDYGLYQYIGPSANTDLVAQAYDDASRWRRVVHDHATDDGPVDLASGELVANRFVVDSVTLQRVDDVDVELANSSLTVVASGDVAVSTDNQMKINRVLSGGKVRLEAGDNITDLYTQPHAAVSAVGNVVLAAGGGIHGENSANPLRTQVSLAGRLRADAGTRIDILQVSDPFSVNGNDYPISDLWVSKANAAGDVLIEVSNGDMIVGRISSDSFVDLQASGSILDAFDDHDGDTAVVNVWTTNAAVPPLGDIYLQAGDHIGMATNFLDIRIPFGELTSLSLNDTFVHSTESLSVLLMTSTAGDVNLDVDGTTNIKKINSLAGTTTVISDDQIVDIEADAASDIDAINVDLTSLNSSIGSLLNDVEIDTAIAGTLAAQAAHDINVAEVTGSLTTDDRVVQCSGVCAADRERVLRGGRGLDGADGITNERAGRRRHAAGRATISRSREVCPRRVSI